MANSWPSQQPLGVAYAPAEGDGVETSPSVSDSVAKTTCYMCACRCGIDVHMKDGKVRYISGNKDHPVNRGVLCGKGSAGIMQHYSPARLKKPLLRTGPRGSGVIGINGAAAHLVQPGDLVILIAYCQVTTEEAKGLVPHVVFVDEDNKVVQLGADPADAPEGSGLLRGDTVPA